VDRCTFVLVDVRWLLPVDPLYDRFGMGLEDDPLSIRCVLELPEDTLLPVLILELSRWGVTALLLVAPEERSDDAPLLMDVDLSCELLDPIRKSADDLDLGE